VPARKFSFYLHPDDRTDRLTAGLLETVSQPLRGDFLRTAAIAGGVLCRIDVRLPALLTEIFDGQLTAEQLSILIIALSGQYSAIAGLNDMAIPAIGWREFDGDENAERRRFSLLLPEGEETKLTAAMLEGTPSRLRGQLLRNIIIAGCALHSLDARLPKLLASLPFPPANLPGLLTLVTQITGKQDVTPVDAVNESVQSTPVVPVSQVIDDGTKALRSKMKKMF
jgi:hypothetical protein